MDKILTVAVVLIFCLLDSVIVLSVLIDLKGGPRFTKKSKTSIILFVGTVVFCTISALSLVTAVILIPNSKVTVNHYCWPFCQGNPVLLGVSLASWIVGFILGAICTNQDENLPYDD